MAGSICNGSVFCNGFMGSRNSSETTMIFLATITAEEAHHMDCIVFGSTFIFLMIIGIIGVWNNWIRTPPL